MYQHVFWFYSHPAVYIMMLPGFGIISEVISTNARKPVFGYRMMAFSLMAIVVLGFSVWAHHMFVSGMHSWLRVPMMITTMLIAVPTGIKIFSWLATLWRGVIHLTTPMLFALGFITMFTLGGISGIILAVIPVVIHVSDTYFVVAHIHYVLFGGSVFTIFAGIYHWFPKMTGRMYDERLGKLHFWMSFIFFNLTFGPMHFVGVDGMPRRVADYAEEFATLNALISASSFIFGLSMLIWLYNMITSWRHGPKAAGNPWRAHTIEWQVSSPPPVFNFDTIPTVVGGPYEYGIPGAQHAVFDDKKPAPARSIGGGDGMKQLLVVANETVGGTALIDAVKKHTEAGDVKVTVDLPAERPQGRLGDLRRRGARRGREPASDDARAAARDRHRGGRRDHGPRPLRGHDGRDPRTSAPDEVIISTHPETRSGWMRKDLVTRIEEDSGLPVEHVVVDLDAEREDVMRTLVVANQTVDSEPLHEPDRREEPRGQPPVHGRSCRPAAAAATRTSGSRTC